MRRRYEASSPLVLPQKCCTNVLQPYALHVVARQLPHVPICLNGSRSVAVLPAKHIFFAPPNKSLKEPYQKDPKQSCRQPFCVLPCHFQKCTLYAEKHTKWTPATAAGGHFVKVNRVRLPQGSVSSLVLLQLSAGGVHRPCGEFADITPSRRHGTWVRL